MPHPSVHEALIYLMVVASASDRDMSDPELGRIGQVVRSWPVFQDFETHRLIEVAQECQLIVQSENGFEQVLSIANAVIPKRLHDTAYAAAFEVAAADLEMRMEEARVLQRLAEALDISVKTVDALGIAGKARCRTLT
jgi:tellurite resistance protein